ncbi:MAG: metallophosphoesterase [Pyrinomonadaceae bacterium]
MKSLKARLLVCFVAIAGAVVLCLVYGYFIEPNQLVVRQEAIVVKGWDPAFDGFRIAMIGDIHGGSNGVTAEKIRHIVELTNEQNPDVIVLLGDYVSQNYEAGPIDQRSLKMPIETIAANLRGFNSKYGVLAVLGNHDGWFNDDKVASELSLLGYRVLQNEVALIEIGGKRLRFLGLKDHMRATNWKAFSDSAKQAAFATDKTGDLVILEHSPDILPLVTGDRAISDDLKLFLAAHTHGGQVWLPILGRPIIPSSYGQKYAYGHVREMGVDMFITSGVGTSILPFRFMVPPEIVVLTIRSE